MDFLELVEKRYSTRSFEPKEIDNSAIEKILNTARLAPSAKNTQPWRFFIAQNKEAKEKVMKAMAEINQWAKNAGLLFVILADMNHAFKKENKNYLIDIGLCLENILLAAEELNLGACACTDFENEVLDKELGLPANLKSVVVIPIGFKRKKTREENILQNATWKKEKLTMQDIIWKRGG